jgi:hypothetical protein
MTDKERIAALERRIEKLEAIVLCEGGQAELPGMGSDMRAEVARIVHALWATQEGQRQSLNPRARTLALTEGRRKVVVERLREQAQAHRLKGMSWREALGKAKEDADHVLMVYAADARKAGDGGRWLNGETNWRKANFARALGTVASAEKRQAPAWADDFDEVVG